MNSIYYVTIKEVMFYTRGSELCELHLFYALPLSNKPYFEGFMSNNNNISWGKVL